MPMSDEDAVKLVNLLAAYAADSVREGATFAEVKEYTVQSVASDIVDTTPAYLLPKLGPLTEDIV